MAKAQMAWHCSCFAPVQVVQVEPKDKRRDKDKCAQEAESNRVCNEDENLHSCTSDLCLQHFSLHLHSHCSSASLLSSRPGYSTRSATTREGKRKTCAGGLQVLRRGAGTTRDRKHSLDGGRGGGCVQSKELTWNGGVGERVETETWEKGVGRVGVGRSHEGAFGRCLVLNRGLKPGGQRRRRRGSWQRCGRPDRTGSTKEG